MRNLALVWVLAACLLGCGGRNAKDKADPAADTATVVAYTTDINDDSYNRTPSLPKTDVSNQLPDEDYLIENLKEIFTVSEKENLNPLKHWLLENFTDTTRYYGNQLKELVGENERKALSGIKSISGYWMRDESNRLSLGKTKSDDLSLEIWRFDNKDNANECFNLMNKAGHHRDEIFMKPPSVFFLVSGTDCLYFFVTRSWNRIPYILLAQKKLINCCFSESDVRFFNPGFGKNWDVLKLNGDGGTAP